MIIAFCGMDGTGKTTLARSLVQDLSTSGKRSHMLHGHEYAVSSNSFSMDENSVRRHRFWLKFLIPGAWLDNIYTYIFKYLPSARDNILILDRYFYDKIARMMYFGICGRKIAKLYARVLPPPDYLFLLDAEENPVHRRKPEYTEVQLGVFRENYRFLAVILECTVIDTTRPIEVCRQRILEVVLKDEKVKEEKK